ncbi:MAG: alpha/beta hydrolase [Victivallaceae bacterium]|nr:alpha/beta hydrolase [Victivallaceae bacterium]
MNSNYKYIDLQGVKIAYRDYGSGQPMLMLHGFGSFSYTWQKLIKHLPQQFRFITVDLKGWGYSEKSLDKTSPYDQAEIVKELIVKLELENIILVGHSMGGTAGLITCFDHNIIDKISKLILIDSAGYFHKMPTFIEHTIAPDGTSFLLKYADEKILAHLVMTEIIFDPEKITEEAIEAYSAVLKLPDAKQSLINSSRQIAIANLPEFKRRLKNLAIKTLIIWGEEDAIIDNEDAFCFKHDLKNSELKIISFCGHSPQEEQPRQTAAAIIEFLELNIKIQPEDNNDNEQKALAAKQAKTSADLATMARLRRMKMRKLLDRWNPTAIMFVATLKILQVVRYLGFSTSENGWRKASQVYLRKEHSKFCLATFRLNCQAPDAPQPTDIDAVRQQIVKRLAAFIKDNAVFHWGINWKRFSAKRHHNRYVDIIEADFDRKGGLLHITPHFDSMNDRFPALSKFHRHTLHQQLVKKYNESIKISDKRRLISLKKRLTKYINATPSISPRTYLEMRHYVKRILNGTFIHFERLPNETGEELAEYRLKTPNFKRRKHPGGGLLNILCRVSANLKECDLWFQYHHIPVDGMPMQEMLEKLKNDWGEAGLFHYPPLSSKAAKPELFYFGNKIFRARVFCDFSAVLAIRKKLNEKYYSEMGGSVSFPCLMLWALTRQKCFRQHKFSMPVDTATFEQSGLAEERNITLMFTRPGKYNNPDEPFDSFLKFARAFNQNLFLTRMGKSESHEFLELCAITHPLFYSFTKYFMPHALKEIVGTVGITVIRNAEMFVSPMTDLQVDGFLAFGNCRIPTMDGKFAGAVSICGSKEQLRQYIPALQEATANIATYIQIPND